MEYINIYKRSLVLITRDSLERSYVNSFEMHSLEITNVVFVFHLLLLSFI